MNRQVVIFVSILLILASIIYLVFVAGLIPWSVFIPLVFVIMLLAVFFPELRQFPEYKRGVVFRLGKFYKVVGPGLALLIPRIDNIVEVDLRTQAVDIDPQNVITKDSIRIKIDAIVYLRVVDPVKSVVEVKNWQESTKAIIHAMIRDAVSKLPLEDVVTKSDEINELISLTFKKTSQEWGILTYKVEIESIDLPETLTEAMKRKKEALERKAEMQIRAETRKLELESLESVASKMSENTLTYLYLESLKNVAEGKSTKIVFPMEFSNLLRSISDKLGKREGKETESLIHNLISNYTKLEKAKPEQKVEEEKPAGKKEVEKPQQKNGKKPKAEGHEKVGSDFGKL